MKSKEIIEFIEARLNEDEIVLIKDTITHGYWGDSTMLFSDGDKYGWVYVTDDAKNGGHFKGRVVSNMFKNIYKKLGILGKPNEFMAQIHDWWCDGSGSILAFCCEDMEEMEKWAKK